MSDSRLKFCCREIDGFLGQVQFKIVAWNTDEGVLYISFGSVAGYEDSNFSYCPFCGVKLEVEKE